MVEQEDPRQIGDGAAGEESERCPGVELQGETGFAQQKNYQHVFYLVEKSATLSTCLHLDCFFEMLYGTMEPFLFFFSGEFFWTVIANLGGLFP